MSDAQTFLDALAQRLIESHAGHVKAVEDLREDPAFQIDRSVLRPVVDLLREEGFEQLILVTGQDNYPEEPRFDVVYYFRSLSRNQDLRLQIAVESDDAVVPTLSDVFVAADWMEREVWDMFGVYFQDHPECTRILMWEGFDAHPLRKDYPLLGNSPGTPGYVGKGDKR